MKRLTGCSVTEARRHHLQTICALGDFNWDIFQSGKGDA